jgi:hypothetical protein
MALTKINFHIGLLGMFAIVVVSMLLFAIDIVDSDRTIDQDSIDYVTDYTGYVSDAELDKFDEEPDRDIIVGNNETGESSVTDFLASINYYSNRVSKITDYLYIGYNLPSFFIASFRLPIHNFTHFVNILTIVLLMAFVILVIKTIRGS